MASTYDTLVNTTFQFDEDDTNTRVYLSITHGGANPDDFVDVEMSPDGEAHALHPDFSSEQQAILTYYNLDPTAFPDFVSSKTRNLKTSAMPSISGDTNVHDLTNLPKDGRLLTKYQCDQLLSRFSKQFTTEVSSGRAAMCLETHINYVIGSSQTLSHLQKSTIEKICALVKYHPTPTLLIAHNVLSLLHHPQAVRRILSASIASKVKHADSIRGQAGNLYKRIFKRAEKVNPILLLGYSQSQRKLAEALALKSNNVGAKLKLITIDRRANGEDIAKFSEYRTYAQAFETSHMSEFVDLQQMGIDEIAELKLSAIITSTKLSTWQHSAENQLTFLSSRQAVEGYEALVDCRRKIGAKDPCEKVIAISGIHKVWHDRFRRFYRKEFLSRGGRGFLDGLGRFRPEYIDCVVTESGIIEPTIDEFIDQFDLKSRSVSIETLFLVLGALEYRGYVFEGDGFSAEKLLSQLIIDSGNYVPSSNFLNSARVYLDLMLPNTLGAGGDIVSEDNSEIPFSFKLAAANKAEGGYSVGLSSDALRERLYEVETAFSVTARVDPEPARAAAEKVLQEFRADMTGIHDKGIVLRADYTIALNIVSAVVRLTPGSFAKGESFDTLFANAIKAAQDLSNANNVALALGS